MQSSCTRKRNRQSENATMVALDLPDIPGVPLDVVPDLVQAVRVATKFYAKCHGRAYYGEEGQESRDNVFRNESSPVFLNALMQRMAAVTAEQDTDPEEDELSKRRKAMNDAAARWLESVKRFAKRADRRNQKREQASEAAAKTGAVSVPFACFLYIWDLQQSHERIAVRRAGIYLTGLLLQRSKDCRFHLQQEDHLGKWLEATFFDYHPAKAADDFPFMQQEGDFWLNHLVENGYGRTYPKIQVALQRLRQRCPNLEAMHSEAHKVSDAAFSSMNDWRRIRDIALTYGDKEIKRVEKWVGRAHICMEILVPRLGINTLSKTGGDSSYHNIEDRVDGNESRAATNNKNGDDSNEEDHIDWEDGYADDSDESTASIPLPDFEHFRAVERTLAAMEESAGGLRGGGIEIDFRDDPHKKADDEMDMKRSDGISEEERGWASATFRKCVSVMASQHLPRITVWIEGLTNADNLVLSRRSLVSLPSDVATKRTNLLHTLAELRRSVSGVLSSAKKLQFEIGTDGADKSLGTRTAVSDDAPLILRLSASSRNRYSGRENLLSKVQRERKQRAQGTRSTKIRIKFYPR